MFVGEKVENIPILSSFYPQICHNRAQILIKIPMVLVLRVSLGTIILFLDNCLYPQVYLQMFSEELKIFYFWSFYP